MNHVLSKIALNFLFLLLATSLSAQYFGRNKVSYEDIDFEVDNTENFRFYHYLDNPERLAEYAKWAEQWYAFHQRILDDTIQEKNPILLYNDHPDFQQTFAINGNIGVGTGGVTEAFKNRVILPFAMSNHQSHHVLGHELVHAFQYNLILNGDSTSIRNLANLPLWMVEGLAEYLSIGSVDAHTAMWLRDAVLAEDFPELKDMNNPKYFPYRFGQAFWAFVTGIYGDGIIEPLFMNTAKFGLEMGIQRTLGVSQKDLSKLWVDGMTRHYKEQLEGKPDDLAGKRLFADAKSGRLNISPEISPNGKYVIFLSEKNIFGIELFLADVRTGEIIRKISKTALNGHIDAINYIESSGTWSPRSDEFAYVAVSGGNNILVITSVENGKNQLATELPGIPAFSNPVWSPDGRTIVLTGLVNGQTDLYAFDIRSQEVTQLTNDKYSELHPAFSADGSKIAFSTDQLSWEKGRKAGQWSLNLAELELASGEKVHHDIFPGAYNLNPEYDVDGNLLFLSNYDGFRNLFRFEPATEHIFQLTDVKTGVSGITPYAPAISIDRKRNRVIYTLFRQGGYELYTAKPDDFLNKDVTDAPVTLAAAQLLRVNDKANMKVDEQLATVQEELDQTEVTLQPEDYKAKFKLDYVGGGAGLGIGGNNQFGTSTGVAGAVDLLFSDITGKQQFFSSIAMNGEIQDFGGSVAYINRENRIQWGAQLSHIPQRFLAGGGVTADSLLLNNGEPLPVLRQDITSFRQFNSSATIFAQRPFSSTLRVEASASYSRFSYRVDVLQNYYNRFGQVVFQDRKRGTAPDGFNLFKVGTALVGDNSYFGLTAPLSGHRFRIGVDQYAGEFAFTAATADLRYYRFFKPFGIAFRAYHYGRYGTTNNPLNPVFAGSPWYVRGYNSSDIQQTLYNNGKSINDLFGQRLLVGNAELRIPFTGPKQLALLGSKFLLTDLNFFFDAGMAYDVWENPKDRPTSNIAFADGEWMMSMGASLRVNVFGAMVLEPFYAKPLLKNADWTFGLNIIPGW